MNKFDLKTVFNESRPLSWSAISSFEWNPQQWYEKYVLKQYPEPTAELLFGGMVDKKIQSDPTFLPLLTRYPVEQFEMRATFNGIPLIGFSDAYQPRVRPAKGRDSVCAAIRDYKTGRKAWDKKRADETGQLTLYAFFLYLMEKIKPEDVELYIDWLPTHIKDGKICFIEDDHTKLVPQTFKTKRTMSQVLKFGQRINDTWIKMEEYCQHKIDEKALAPKTPVSRFLK